MINMKLGSPTLIKKEILVSAKDLPLYCPPKDKTFWAMHPRIYLEFDETKKVACHYCGTKYKIST